MKNSKRRQTSVPCYTCLEIVSEHDEVIYCSVCGEQYHKKCWLKNNSKCKVYRCSGDSYRIWHKIEPVILGFLGVGNSKLLKECPNCKYKLSPLDRYCGSCGYDVNRPEKQSSFSFYSLSLFIRKFRKIVYLFSLAFLLLFVGGVSAFIVNTVSAAQDYINEYATQNAPTITSTYTITPTFFTYTPRPTLTKTIVPTTTNTLRPTATKTPRPTFTNTPRPTATKTLRPTPTVILPPKVKNLVAIFTFKPTQGQSPITVTFNAGGSYLEYNNGSREDCWKAVCQYSWKFPDGFETSFSGGGGIVPFRFTRSGTFNVYVKVCWNGICDDFSSSVTIK